MLRKVILFSLLIIILFSLGILGLNYWHAFLFQTNSWILAIPLSLGLFTAGLRAGIQKSKRTVYAGLEKRHTVAAYLEHWGTAMGIFMLIISGLLLLIQPTFFQSNLHFLGLFMVLLFGSYFAVDFFSAKKFNDLLPNYNDIIDGTVKKYLHIIKWEDNGKYLASQKTSFLAFTTFGLGILITGVIKLAGILVSLPAELIQISTWLHDIAGALFVVLVVVHILLALLVRYNRLLLLSWFTGKMAEEGQKKTNRITVTPDAKSD